MKTYTRTKILATLGPASSDQDTILHLIEAGVDAFRLNFSHGTHEQKAELIQHIRQLNIDHNFSVAIIADLQGPKIRLGKIENDHFDLAAGDTFIITTDRSQVGTREKVSISYDGFPMDVVTGDTILIDDGKVEVEVVDNDKTAEVTVKMLMAGRISSNKGVNLPNADVSLPSLTEKDLKDLEFAIEQDVDWVALSFVRTEKDIMNIREYIHKFSRDNDKDRHAKIIAKIEKPQAVTNIDKIIAKTDAIMIARGDLGVEMKLQDVPIIQKQIVEKCLLKSKPVIIATQMMESMIENNKPTRAEVTDVANAIFDGADVVMLSGETAMGKYPVQVIETMRKIITTVEEKSDIYFRHLTANPHSPTFISDAVCYSACRLAESVQANAIIGMTRSGYTAYMTSSCRPKAKIYVFSDNRRLLSRMSLVWGVRGFYYDQMVSTDNSINDVQEYLKERDVITAGDVVINLASMPLHKQGRTNMVKVTKLE